MNDEELWEIENPQNPWLIKKEEEQKRCSKGRKINKRKRIPNIL